MRWMAAPTSIPIGVVLYRLLTANLPFKADTAIAMAQKQVKDPPTPLRQFRAELPSWCQDILDRALAKAPDERFQTADEFRAALGHAGAAIANVGSTTPVPTEPTGLSGMDVTVPPNVMITPVTGVRHVVPVSVDSVEHAPPVAVPPAAAVQQRRPPIGRASAQQLALPVAALVLIVALGIGVTWMRRQRGAALSTPPATQASVDPGVSPTSTAAVPPAPDVTLQPAAAPTPPPAAKPTSEAPRPSLVKPTRAADVSKPVAARPDATVASAPTAPPETLAVRASSPLLPPLVFKSVDLLMVDGRKTRDRDAALRLADGAVQVLDGETRLRHGALRQHHRDLLIRTPAIRNGSPRQAPSVRDRQGRDQQVQVVQRGSRLGDGAHEERVHHAEARFVVGQPDRVGVGVANGPEGHSRGREELSCSRSTSRTS